MAAGPEIADGRRIGRLYGLVIMLLVVVGGVGSTLYARWRWWLPPVASVQGQSIDRLFYSTLYITGAVFVLVHVLLALFLWRYGAHGDQPAAYFHEHKSLELTYTIIPAVVLAVMVSMGGVVWSKMHGAPPKDALLAEVRGEQFAWMMRYPGPDGVFGKIDPRQINRDNPMGLDRNDQAAADDIVTRELHLVLDRPVRLRIRSRDVIHSFYVPAFRMKQDAVPGMNNEIWFTPTTAGDPEIACAELCGVGHYIMRGKVRVESQADFDAWLAQQKK